MCRGTRWVIARERVREERAAAETRRLLRRATARPSTTSRTWSVAFVGRGTTRWAEPAQSL
jgi:hypothetical protein